MRNALFYLLIAAYAQSQVPPTPPTEIKNSKIEAPKQGGAPMQRQLIERLTGESPRPAPDPGNFAGPATRIEPQRDVQVTAIPTLSVGKDYADYVLVVATALLVLVGGSQLYFLQKTIAVAKVSADAAAKNADVAQRTMEISQRANLAVSAIRLKGPPPHLRSSNDLENLLHSRVEFVVKNTGATEARSFHFMLTISIEGLEAGIKTPEPIVSHPTNLHSGFSAGRCSDELQKMFFSLHAQNAVMAGKLRANGFVRYRDIFSEKGYYIEFSSNIDPNTLEFEITTEALTDEEQQKRATQKRGGDREAGQERPEVYLQP